MQGNSVIFLSHPYDEDMPAGRPPKFKRTAFGERLFLARQQAGLSQTQIAQKLGVTQPTYADWERRTTALRPEHLSQLADILNVAVDHLLGRDNGHKARGGPIGKARRVFEAVSRLPRHQQQKIVDVVETFVAGHGNGHKQAA